MQLQVDVLDETGLVDVDLVAGVVAEAVSHLDTARAGDWVCTVRIAGTEAIAALHGQFFGDPSDTDVMSFPSGEPMTEPGGYLGDVAISLEMAREQSVEAGHSLTREIAYLALHGMLHLLGYDDEHEEDRKAMLSLQDALLSEAELAHGMRL